MVPARSILTILATALAAATLCLAAVSPVAADSESVQERNQFYRDLHRMHGGGATAGGGDGGDDTVLMVSGVIGPGAHYQFRSALAYGSTDLIVLDGPGGVLGEALLIAEEVRRRNLSTLVAPNRSCASACAIVFLSGRNKYLGAGAAVGLHSASFADGRADPEATQLMADYLRQLGVPDSTLRRMAATAPSDIRWLTPAEQRAIGIRAYRPQ